MPRIEFKSISDDAYAWVFGISPRLAPEQEKTLLRHVDAFLDVWSSHGQPIVSARDVKEGSFLVIAAEKSSERSGCSIDRLFGTLRKLEQEFGVSILDAGRVFHRAGDGQIQAKDRASFGEGADPHTVVFDTTAESVGLIRSGAWERPAAESWHRSLLKPAPSHS